MNSDNLQVGASFIARREKSEALEILHRLIKENPGKGRNDLFPLFDAETDDSPHAMRAIKWYFLVNFYSYEIGSRSAAGRRRPDRASALAATRERVEEIKTKILLMDLILPSGQRVAEATFRELAKAGGWFAKAAQLGKPNQIVGKTVTEADLRAIK